jgi:hypothetical protein
MRATLTSVKQKQPSKYGGYVTLLTFKGVDGKNYVSWIATNCRNHNRWETIINAEPGTMLDGLWVKKDNLIDADCLPKIINVDKKDIVFPNEEKESGQSQLRL